MNLYNYLNKRVKLVTTIGNQFIGRVDDFTSSADNDDEGEYICIRPESGKLEGESVAIFPEEIKSIEVMNG